MLVPLSLLPFFPPFPTFQNLCCVTLIRHQLIVSLFFDLLGPLHLFILQPGHVHSHPDHRYSANTSLLLPSGLLL